MKSGLYFSFAAALAEALVAQGPVTKVVGMLKDLQKEIEADGDKEQKLYDKYACWCKDTMKAKKAQIEAAESNIALLTTKIESLTGEGSSKEVMIDQLKKDIAQNAKDQDDAVAMRKKEHDAWYAKTEDLKMALTALEKAITVLEKGTGTKRPEVAAAAGTATSTPPPPANGAFLAERTPRGTMADDLRMAMALSMRTDASDKSAVKDWLSEFSKEGRRSMRLMQLSQPGNYVVRSGKIMGIFSSMVDEFKTDLQQADDAEKRAEESFEELKAEKEKEAERLQNTLTERELRSGEIAKELGDSKQERSETQEVLSNTKTFLQETTDSCQAKANAWSERSRLRTEELAGIMQAIKILSSGEFTKAHENAASKSFFTQLVSSSSAAARAQKVRTAVAALSGKSLRLARLAVEVRTSNKAIDEVILRIDQMMKSLKDEELEDKKAKEICDKKEGNAAADAEMYKNKMEALEAKQSQQKEQIAALQKKQEANEDAMKESADEIAKAQQMRESEFADFQQKVKDMQTSIKLMEEARVVLEKFQNSLSFVSIRSSSQKAVQSPPPTFEGSYGGRANESGNIGALLEMLIDDMKLELKDVLKEEGDNAAEFMAMKTTQMNSIEEMEKKNVSLQFQETTTEKAKSKAENAHDAADEQLASTEDTQAQLSGTNCKWTRKSYESRIEHRNNEMKGLLAAKSALQGIALA